MARTVLHLIPSLEVGGAETLLLDLVRGTGPGRYRHRVVSMLPGGALVGAFRSAGVTAASLGMRSGLPDPRGYLRLRQILRAERPLLLHAWMYHANLLGLAAAARVRPAIPVVWTLHAAALDFGQYSPLTRLATFAGAHLAGRPAAVVANSEATRAYHARLGYRPREWTVIHNGVDVRRFKPDPAARTAVREELGVPADARLVGMAARWDPMKDHATFLRAAAEVGAIDPRAHFVLAGHGITRENGALARLIAEMDAVAPRVHLLGLRRDMPRVNAALDVVAVTSVSGESFCLAAAEAMACGVSCVVTDLTFLPDLVGDTGVVVPLRSPSDLAAAITRLLGRTDQERNAASARARERIATHFSLDAMVAGYEALYARLLHRAPAADPLAAAGGAHA
ncbi:MAG TPA: glycosyltransferase [Gemmatimonadales bacterium]|nr:glycosyltransferase [Gemmatimonadales bacterium]